MSRNVRKRAQALSDADSDSSDELSGIMTQLNKLSRKVSRLQKKRKRRKPSPESSDSSVGERSFSQIIRPATVGLVNYDTSSSGPENNLAERNVAISDGTLERNIVAECDVAERSVAERSVAERSVAECSVAERSVAISDEILRLLGKNSVDDQASTKDINSELVQIWSHILQEGLDSEVLATICKKYSPPTNLSLANAPKLNSEVLSVLTEQHKQRDLKLSKRQDQMGAALVAIGKALTILLEKGEGAHTRVLVECLSDAGRLISDIHHEESTCRRNLVSVSVDKQLRGTLSNVSVDGWLFGQNLGDRVKAAREMEKLSSNLKPKAVTATLTSSVNFKGLPRVNVKGYRGRPKYSRKTPSFEAKTPRKAPRSTKEIRPAYRTNQTQAYQKRTL
ncbi:unnamed protein product [Acanthoscelides obtectus]|uniref:Uncharacterized protein n=1 Tax=Acanthoscelides obtectus TaxID=200917 RepID=A0A9P0PFS4_ACAOB|nr:unnamed protein product [Acanthoscelides obtectus]CAK1654827.1 hypothetical protein AOBTE_LOCUS18876 [Acanthoscelides obtectus]